MFLDELNDQIADLKFLYPIYGVRVYRSFMTHNPFLHLVPFLLIVLFEVSRLLSQTPEIVEQLNKLL